MIKDVVLNLSKLDRSFNDCSWLNALHTYIRHQRVNISQNQGLVFWFIRFRVDVLIGAEIYVWLCVCVCVYVCEYVWLCVFLSVCMSTCASVIIFYVITIWSTLLKLEQKDLFKILKTFFSEFRTFALMMLWFPNQALWRLWFRFNVHEHGEGLPRLSTSSKSPPASKSDMYIRLSMRPCLNLSEKGRENGMRENETLTSGAELCG